MSGFRQVSKCIFSKVNILQSQALDVYVCNVPIKEKRVIQSKCTYTIVFVVLLKMFL